jgi:hypothetical protein
MGERKRHRLDSNHKAIRKALEARGALFIDTSQTNLGFDALVVPAGFSRLVPVEIKDPASSRGLKLSPKEAAVHRELKARGITVEILTDDASLDVLTQPARADFYASERNNQKPDLP